MKILYWTEAYWPSIGGTEVASVLLMRGLRAQGHELLVVTSLTDPGLPASEEHEGIQIRRLPFREAVAAGNPANVFKLLQQTLEVVADFQPDLFHLGLPGPSCLFCLQACRRKNIPLVFTHQLAGAWIEGTRPDQMVAHAAQQANRVVFPSQGMLEEAVRSGIDTERSLVIYNGIELDSTDPAPLPWDPPVVAATGRFSHEKGFDVLVEAVHHLAAGGTQLRLLLAGDGAERPALESMVDRWDLQGVVEFLGWLKPEAVPDLLRGATVLVAPSRAEAFGLSALEAQAAARPVVATRVGGLPEIVMDGETGRLVASEDPQALAEGIADILSDRDRARAMGLAARARVHDRFSIRAQAKAYEDLYKEVLGEGND